MNLPKHLSHNPRIAEVLKNVVAAHNKIKVIESSISTILGWASPTDEIHTTIYRMRQASLRAAEMHSESLVTDATVVSRNIYDVSPYSSLRRILDSEHAVDVRANESTERWKIRLIMQKFHPDAYSQTELSWADSFGGVNSLFAMIKSLQHLETVNVLCDSVRHNVDEDVYVQALRKSILLNHRIESLPSMRLARLGISNSQKQFAIQELNAELNRLTRKVF